MKLNAWFLVAAVTWALGHYLLRHHPELSVSWKVIVTFVPLIPGLLYIRSCMCFIRGLDELQRRIQLEVLLFAAMGTVVIGACISSLSEMGIHMGKEPLSMNIGGAFVSMMVLWVVGSVITNRRYR